MRKRVSVRWLLLIFVIIFTLYFFDVIQFNFYQNIYRKPIQNKYTIETSGCKIPHLELNDEAIVGLLNELDIEEKCSDNRPIILSNTTGLFFDPTALEDYGFKNISELDCGYRPFWRVDPVRDSEDDFNVKFGNRTTIGNYVRVDEEFVRVDCKPTGGGSIVFREFYSFVPVKKWEKYSKNNQSWNVAIIGIDSLSRMHVRRKMPKTVEALKKIGAIEMLGYNKVEDNTFPNIIPMISGISWLELLKGCWKSYQHRFDDCWFVFNDFNRAGYLTAWAEEKSDFGIFNYLKKGWTHQPVDIYYNIFDEIARKQIGHTNHLNYPDCIGSRYGFDAVLDHTERVISRGVESNRPFFSFTWITTLAHNNYDTASIGDNSVSELILRLESNRLIDRTILIVMSDHGYRWGAMTQTQQGHLENRLPFMFWKLPSGFPSEKVKNLEINSKRLITTFDLFATFHDIIGDKINKSERSVSLFTEIPESRTCDSADIPAHYCTCFEPLPVDVDEVEVRVVADFLVRHINELLKGHGCAEVSLVSVKSAGLVAAGDSNRDLRLSTRDYTVTLKIDPNGATISGTVRVFGDDMQVAGTVSRLDWYGNQSHCVSDPTLKLYCQCL